MYLRSCSSGCSTFELRMTLKIGNSTRTTRKFHRSEIVLYQTSSCIVRPIQDLEVIADHYLGLQILKKTSVIPYTSSSHSDLPSVLAFGLPINLNSAYTGTYARRVASPPCCGKYMQLLLVLVTTAFSNAWQECPRGTRGLDTSSISSIVIAKSGTRLLRLFQL
jgi:hypothetical protein